MIAIKQSIHSKNEESQEHQIEEPKEALKTG